MKKNVILMVYMLIIINTFTETVPYTDISPEHWAYKSIENLYKKGILDTRTDIFNGEKSINRFEMAYYLSKALEKIDNEKADRDDLQIIEHIMYEFSEELTKFGFEVKTYTQKVDGFDNRIEENKLVTNTNKVELEKLDLRVKAVEKSINRKDLFLGLDTTNNDKFKYFNNFSLYLKSNVDYKLNDDKNSFKGAHKIGLAFKKDNYELFLESETSDKERKKGELLVKGQIETEILDGLKLNFHTADYERYFRSYFNNVIYDNHNSYYYVDATTEKEYQYDSFDSYGLALANENVGVYVEKTRSDYDNKFSNATAVTVDKAFSDTFNFIADVNYKFFKGLILKNGNNNNLDFELAGKYPINKFELVLAYAEKRGSGRTISGVSEADAQTYNLLFDKLTFINGEIVYGGKNNFTLGFERKNNDDLKLYTTYYGSYKYNLSERGKIKYKYEYINRNETDYQNHYFVLNVAGEKLNTYGAYNIISLNKKYLINNNSVYPSESFYKETILKMTYKFSEKFLAKIGYLLREYDENNVKRQISFLQGQYNIDKNTLFYAKYIKNIGIDFNDRKLDVDNNIVDLDFDSKTGVIREAKEGRIEIGVELAF